MVYMVIWKLEQFPLEVAFILEDFHITDGFFHEAVFCKLFDGADFLAELVFVTCSSWCALPENHFASSAWHPEFLPVVV